MPEPSVPSASQASGFDRLGRLYGWMERCFAGPLMQRCRTAHLSALQQAQTILTLGEGPGRFLQAVLASNSHAQVLCVDGSASMLEQSRRIAGLAHALDRVSFQQTDLVQWSPSPNSVDVLTTHFFLDCFNEAQLETLIPRFTSAVKPGGLWIVSDFRIPRGLLHRPAKLLLRFLYTFFRTTTGIAAEGLVDPSPLLQKGGLILESSQPIFGGILRSDLWRKPKPETEQAISIS